MLVNGQIIRGAIVSSYAYTMGFVVSARRVIKEAFCTALQKLILGSTPPQKYNKINILSNKIKAQTHETTMSCLACDNKRQGIYEFLKHCRPLDLAFQARRGDRFEAGRRLLWLVT